MEGVPYGESSYDTCALSAGHFPALREHLRPCWPSYNKMVILGVARASAHGFACALVLAPLFCIHITQVGDLDPSGCALVTRERLTPVGMEPGLLGYLGHLLDT